MRARFYLATAVMLAGSAAQAGTLVSATWTQNLEGIAITVTGTGATCSDTNPAHVPGAGFITCPTTGLQATGSSTATSYNVGITMPLFEMQAFTTAGSVDIATHATLQGAQNVSGGAASATATQGIAGIVTLGIGGHTRLSMYEQGHNTIVKIPLGIGKAGAFTGVSTVLGGGFYNFITVDFYGWTPGTVSFMSLTFGGISIPDVVAMGSFDLTDEGGGTVTLISPSKISIDSTLPFYVPAQRRTGSFATLKLTFVPEPSTLLLLGAGALVLLGFARRS